MRLSNPTLRAALVALAASAVVTTISACSSPAEPEETTGASTTPSESTESTEPEADDAAPAEAGLCTAEQFNTIAGATSGTTVSDEQLSSASATFEPAAAIEGVTTVCTISLSMGEVGASIAVVSGGAAALTTVQSNLTNAGATPTASGEQFIAMTADQTIIGGPLSSFSQTTAGFENPADLNVLLVSSGAL